MEHLLFFSVVLLPRLAAGEPIRYGQVLFGLVSFELVKFGLVLYLESISKYTFCWVGFPCDFSAIVSIGILCQEEGRKESLSEIPGWVKEKIPQGIPKKPLEANRGGSGKI